MLAMATIFLLSILAGYHRNMKLVIELDREVDGRWIADIRELGVLLYGECGEEVVQKAQDAARDIISRSHRSR
jgi:hypothetical protein